MSFKTIFIAIIAIVSFQGCVYRMDIPQGNGVDAKKLQQLKLGMTRSQVEFLLGSPAIVDLYHPHQANYVSYLYNGKTQKSTLKKMILTYDDKGVLTKIEGKL